MSIVSYELPESIAKEFSINAFGVGSVSRRGLARLSGANRGGWGRGGHFFTQEIDEMLTQHGFEGGSFVDDDDRITDVIATLVIQHYAFKGNKTAQSTLKALGAVGLRTVIQSALNWQSKWKPTQREIVDQMCLPVPTEWKLRFGAEFYGQLSRLTGLDQIGNKRPLLWAKITKELVYDYMPSGVYEEIKAWQLATDHHKKLHQYLSDFGIEMLTEHLKRVITLMQGASSMSEVELMLSQSITKQYQQSLFAVK